MTETELVALARVTAERDAALAGLDDIYRNVDCWNSLQISSRIRRATNLSYGIAPEVKEVSNSGFVAFTETSAEESVLQQLKAVYNPRPEWSEAVQRNLTIQVNMWLVSQIIEYMEKR